MFIQVSQSIANPTTKERKTQALAEAMREVKGSKGLIITEDGKETVSINGAIISVVPVYEWLLS